jgi:hypothetical protein
VAARLLASPSDALAVVDDDGRSVGVLTVASILRWAAGGGDAHRTIARLAVPIATPPTVAPDISLAEGVLAMGSAGVEALAVTQDGTRNSRLQALVTTRDLAPLFGEHPVGLLSEIGSASSTADLREINKRTRAFALPPERGVCHRLAEPPAPPGRSGHLCANRDADGRRCRQRLLVLCRVVGPRGVADETCASSGPDPGT